jgi:predicted naringenin-chalcone synthase
MYLHSIAPAWPDHTVSQSEALQLLRTSAAWELINVRSRGVLEKVLTGESGITQRHVCSTDVAGMLTAAPHDLALIFEKTAPHLAARALTLALDKMKMEAGALDALFLCTCTGYLCPGVTSHVAEITGMRRDAVLHDLVGLGCGAAIPTMRAAHDFLAANPAATVAVVAVEICTAAFYLDNDVGVLISLCLFGDGACASIWRSRKPEDGIPWRAHGFRSLHQPEHREKIRFVNSGGRLRNQLHRSVPFLAAAAVKQLHDADLAAGLPPEARIISHSGGRDVIDALRAILPGHPLSETEEVLRTCGNMSSPSVLIALHQALENGVTSPLWLTAFGAGFTAHSCRMDPEAA